jgi:RmuC family
VRFPRYSRPAGRAPQPRHTGPGFDRVPPSCRGFWPNRLKLFAGHGTKVYLGRGELESRGSAALGKINDSNGHPVIDANGEPHREKVRLERRPPYTDYISADTDYARKLSLLSHLNSVRKHITLLSEREYQQVTTSSLNFVIMFVPIEGALALALQMTHSSPNSPQERMLRSQLLPR